MLYSNQQARRQAALMYTLPATSRVRLDGGRQLSYRTYGQQLHSDSHVVYHHGWPSCSLEPVLLHKAAAELGLAIVALDRPGVEDSSIYPGGIASFDVYCACVDAFMQHLGIERAVMVGTSGGGPYACAVASQLPHRTTALVLIASMTPLTGPGTSELLRGMAWSNRLSYALPTHLPTVTRLLLALVRPLIQSLPNLGAWGLPGRLLLLAAGCGTGFAAVDWLALLTRQELGQLVVPLLQGAMRRGCEGYMQDMLLTCQPWAVDIGQVACPVLVARGGEDVNVAAAMVAWFRRQFEAGGAKGVRVLEVPGEGHLSLMAGRGREVVLRAVVHLLQNA